MPLDLAEIGRPRCFDARHGSVDNVSDVDDCSQDHTQRRTCGLGLVMTLGSRITAAAP